MRPLLQGGSAPRCSSRRKTALRSPPCQVRTMPIYALCRYPHCADIRSVPIYALCRYTHYADRRTVPIYALCRYALCRCTHFADICTVPICALCRYTHCALCGSTHSADIRTMPIYARCRYPHFRPTAALPLVGGLPLLRCRLIVCLYFGRSCVSISVEHVSLYRSSTCLYIGRCCVSISAGQTTHSVPAGQIAPRTARGWLRRAK